MIVKTDGSFAALMNMYRPPSWRGLTLLVLDHDLPVEEDVGRAGGAGGEHRLLAGRRHLAVVAVEPRTVAGVENVRHVVTLQVVFM